MDPTNISKSSSTESSASEVELLLIDGPTPMLKSPILNLSTFEACWLIAEHESLLENNIDIMEVYILNEFLPLFVGVYGTYDPDLMGHSWGI